MKNIIVLLVKSVCVSMVIDMNEDGRSRMGQFHIALLTNLQ